MALIYPNSYKVGMSSLGFQLVYSLLNDQDVLVCERFFLPQAGEKLRSVESERPLHHFPIVFISISFEHDYLHLVQMLLAAGIEPYAEKRSAAVTPESPLVVCGGVATFMNPEPLAPFVDLFLVGEAEPVLAPLATALAERINTETRQELLLEVSRALPGCYAPVLYTPEYDQHGLLVANRPSHQLPERVSKVILERCDKAAHSQLLTPEAEFSDLYLTELGRGCSRGCRFCAAGFIYRPPRLWDGDAVVQGLAERFEGVGRIGLLGMEMADIGSLGRISDYLHQSGCALSFSSLRADRLSTPLLELLSASKLKSVAIAPDGSSERLRRVINKGLREEDLLNAAEKLVAAGIFKLKIYLMIGLPTETDDDLQEAIELLAKIKERIDPLGKERGRLCEISLSVNCFAPKPWTPFQYHPFGISSRLKNGERGSAQKVVADLQRRLKLLRQGIRGLPNVNLQHDKPENVLFQAVLSRGDRRVAPVLVQMARQGISWKQAMKKQGLSAEQFAVCGFDETTYFPWYIIDHGIRHDYLWLEYLKAFEQKLTVACDTRICHRCGVCHD